MVLEQFFPVKLRISSIYRVYRRSFKYLSQHLLLSMSAVRYVPTHRVNLIGTGSSVMMR